MDIQKADIKLFELGSLNSRECENVEHIKVLPWLSVVQAKEGNYDIALDNQSRKNTGDGGFFIAPAGVQQDITHHVHSKSGVMRARWLFIDAIINETISPDFFYDFPTILPTEYCDELNSIFDTLFSTEDIFEKYACCYRVLKILVKIGQPKLHKSNEPMVSVFDYIRKNYMKEIRVEDMAKYLNMSESNFYAVFKKHFGLPPIAYINKFRISVAEEKLKKTDDTIAKIASSVGISDPIYFNKLFHRDYQVSPKEYRKKYKQNMKDGCL